MKKEELRLLKRIIKDYEVNPSLSQEGDGKMGG